MRVALAPRALQDLAALPKATARKIADLLDRLGDDLPPANLDVKPLVGPRPWKRVRVGQQRILFRTIDGNVILVARIVNRRDLDRAVRSLAD